MRALRIGAWAAFGTTVAAAAYALLAVAGVAPQAGDDIPPAIVPFLCAALLAPAVVGILVAHRLPANRIAWILLLGPIWIVVGPLEVLLGDGWALQIDRATWPLLYAWPIAVAFVFPDGRLLSPRWRWVAGAAAASFTLFIGLALLDPSPHYPPNEDVPNPVAGNAFGEFVVSTGIWIPLWLGILGSLFAGALAVWLRLRRSTGIERLQTLWLAWAAVLVPLGLVLCAISNWIVGGFVDAVVFPFLLLMQVAVAASIGVAVARYRLYAIERLINRTAVYAPLTFLLACLYVAITIGLGVALGRGSAWVTAAATLAVALAFRPLRSLVQDRVDRRFSRTRWDALRRVQAFEAQVRDNRRAPEEIGAVLAAALGDRRAELFYWLPESEAFADSAGLVRALPEDGRAPTTIERDGARTAVLLHDPALLERRELLRGVLAAATLSIEIARLRVELRLQLAEVEASRARIVEAGYEERRRLERDLHDGAQQRLVSLGMRLRRMQRTLPREAYVLRPAFDQIVDEVGAAIADLRQIAAGVRPARLDEGLASALRDLARTVPVPVEVDAPIGRFAAGVEAAVYFVACEALTNAVKHAAATRVALRAVQQDGALLVSVVDDGVGGAVARRGSGLAGLHDRVAAHGGTFALTSPDGGGTRIEVAIPCAS